MGCLNFVFLAYFVRLSILMRITADFYLYRFMPFASHQFSIISSLSSISCLVTVTMKSSSYARVAFHYPLILTVSFKSILFISDIFVTRRPLLLMDINAVWVALSINLKLMLECLFVSD